MSWQKSLQSSCNDWLSTSVWAARIWLRQWWRFCAKRLNSLCFLSALARPHLDEKSFEATSTHSLAFGCHLFNVKSQSSSLGLFYHVLFKRETIRRDEIPPKNGLIALLLTTNGLMCSKYVSQKRNKAIDNCQSYKMLLNFIL